MARARLCLSLLGLATLLIAAGVARGQTPEAGAEAEPCAYNPAPSVHGGEQPPAAAQPGDLWVSPKDDSVLVAVPAGVFGFGSTEDLVLTDGKVELGKAEKPYPVQILLDGFWVQKYEVSNAQFAAFVKATGYEPTGLWSQLAGEGRETHAACGVSFADACGYAEWAGLALPTEAQWEKAARSAARDARFPWGTDEEEAGAAERANHNPSDAPYPDSARRLSAEDLLQCLKPVDAYPEGRSPYGVYGMSGNVEEWTASPYRSADELAASLLRELGCVSVEMVGDLRMQDDPLSDVLLGGAGANADTAVCRGGGWRDGQWRQTVFHRMGRPTKQAMSLDLQTGFRCVLNSPVSAPREDPAAGPEEDGEVVRCTTTFRLELDGTPIKDAKLDDFEVWELLNGDGWQKAQPVDLECMMKQVKGLCIMLVIDRSGSMTSDDRIEKAKAAASEVVKSLKPEDKIGLVSFASDVSIDRALGAPDQEMLYRIGTLKAAGGTSFYDGVWAGIEELKKSVAEDMPGLILALSDGGDTASRREPSQLIEFANYHHVPIYCGGLGLRPESGREMVRISQETRGAYTSSENMDEITESWLGGIIVELGANTYKLVWDGRLPKGVESEVLIDYRGLGAPFEAVKQTYAVTAP